MPVLRSREVRRLVQGHTASMQTLNSRCAHALSHVTVKPPAHRSRWSLPNVPARRCRADRKWRAASSPTVVTNRAPWRVWLPSGGGRVPSVLAMNAQQTWPFAGRLSPLEGAQGSGAPVLFWAGQTWQRSMSQARDVGCHSCCYNSPPSCSRPQEGVASSALREATERERGLPHLPGEDSEA